MPKGKKEKVERRQRIHDSIREDMFGTSVRPRLSVYRSNKYIYAQLIDDIAGHTITAASSLEDAIASDEPVDASREVGRKLAERAQEEGINKAVFDRGGYRYHGRVRAVAEGAREGGLSL